MFDVIVVGTDGSETATAAVHKAVMLASQSDATLHIVHAQRLVSAGQLGQAASVGAATFDLDEVNRGIAHAGQLVCDNAASQAGLANVKHETHVCDGDAADALVQVAQQVGADLIVIGNRGMTGMKRFVLGSVPNKVSHHAPCSLLIVDTSRT